MRGLFGEISNFGRVLSTPAHPRLPRRALLAPAAGGVRRAVRGSSMTPVAAIIIKM